eukprot:TRINITY_DN9916_c0_g1_i1.p1 TRINITY_DN9916_c0_g1~~TRINITY_DN9916_c0_g1_i1.p1  ORF type:complete len:758 (-),score=174.92 TRINITY_DN9916_c0_g1_i1:136-2289(-)
MTHPKYLHSNSTSHKWVFGAIAELIDNAVDAKANQFHIIAEPEPSPTRLIFQDNGRGMSPKILHKMVSFGHCSKGEGDIGKYGNGFKSGAMRVGQDALVLTSDGTTLSAAFLSQTFLKATNAKEVLVPMLSWDKDYNLMNQEDPMVSHSLEMINRFSPYTSHRSLKEQLSKLPETGTRIIVINLRLAEDEQLEFDFSKKPNDIHIKLEQEQSTSSSSDSVEVDYSLREYCKILYLRPVMQIYIRGQRVRPILLTHTLYKPKIYTYKPSGANQPITMTFGFNISNRYRFGMMLYNRNRLIRYYLRIGTQLAGNSIGNGVIGVVDAPFLQPTHNKQDFVTNSQYISLKKTLVKKLAEFWEYSALDKVRGGIGIGEFWKKAKTIQLPVWVQCDNPDCMKWRKLEVAKQPDDGVDWFCRMNAESEHNECGDAEENLDVVHSSKKGKRKRRTQDEILDQELSKLSKQERLLKKKRRILTRTSKSNGDDSDEFGTGAELEGKKVKIFWKEENQWFNGRILKYKPSSDQYQIEYEDGDITWESRGDHFKLVYEEENLRRSSRGPKLIGGEEAASDEEDGIDDGTALIREKKHLDESFDKIKYILDSLSVLLPIHETTVLLDYDQILEFDEKRFCKAIIESHKQIQENKRKTDSEIKSLEDDLNRWKMEVSALTGSGSVGTEAKTVSGVPGLNVGPVPSLVTGPLSPLLNLEGPPPSSSHVINFV